MVPWSLLLLIYIASALLYLLLLPKCRTGWTRVLASMPLLLSAAALPFPLNKATARGSVAFVVSWLTVFKALAAAMGHGPLGSCSTCFDHEGSSKSRSSNSTNCDRAGSRQLTLVQQAALLLLPLTERHRGAQQQQRQQKQNGSQHEQRQQQDDRQHGLLPEVTLKLASGFAVIVLLHTVQLHKSVRHLLYAVIVWIAVSVLLDFPSALLGRLLGLHLSPAMDSPLASTGIADFWGRRYNRAVSAVLRFTVYEPLLQLLGSSSSGGGGGRGSGDGGTSGGNTGSSSRYGNGGGSGSGGCSSSGPSVQQGAYVAAKAHRERTQLAKAVATTAAFGVSGLMHEICTWHMCQTSYVTQGHFMPGRHTLFFLLQAPLVLLEKHLTLKWSSSSSNSIKTGSGGSSSNSRGKAGLEQSDKVDHARSPIVNLVASSCTPQQQAETPAQLRGGGSGVSWVYIHAGRVLRSCCTLGVLLLLAEFLFWPPLESCAADVNGIAELSDMLSSTASAFGAFVTTPQT